MRTKAYLVVKDHMSEFPEPITFERDALLVLGERYEGPEGWENWILCESPGQKAGWVPAQILEVVGEKTARAREDYTARELSVREGEFLRGERILNGWIWCEKSGSAESGWVPLANLQQVQE